MFIGTKIEEIRKNTDITQVDLAKRIGLSRASIVNIECGRQRCTTMKLYQICDILNCEFTDILPSMEWFRENKHKKVRRVVKIEIDE